MTGESGRQSNTLDWESLRARLKEATKGVTQDHSMVDTSAILDQRATIAARPAATIDSGSASIDVISFTISGESYAIEARFVAEVISHFQCTPIPNTPKHLLGIANRRSEAIAVFDLRELLGIPPINAVNDWLIVVGEEQAEFGFVVDAVNDVSRMRLDSLLRSTGSTSTGGELVRGVNKEAVVLIDGTALLEDRRLWINAPTNSSTNRS